MEAQQPSSQKNLRALVKSETYTHAHTHTLAAGLNSCPDISLAVESTKRSMLIKTLTLTRSPDFSRFRHEHLHDERPRPPGVIP